MPKLSAIAYLAAGLAIGLVVGVIVGHFLVIPQQVRVSGTVSGSFRPIKVIFAIQTESCVDTPSSAGCVVGANVTDQSTYTIVLQNNREYQTEVNYQEASPI